MEKPFTFPFFMLLYPAPEIVGKPCVKGCEDCPDKYVPGSTTSESRIESDKLKAEEHFFLYPNPTRSFVNIELNNTNEAILEIYSPQGSILKSLEIQNDSIIDIKDLKSGHYLCVLRNHRKEYLASKLLIINQ